MLSMLFFFLVMVFMQNLQIKISKMDIVPGWELKPVEVLAGIKLLSLERLAILIFLKKGTIQPAMQVSCP